MRPKEVPFNNYPKQGELDMLNSLYDNKTSVIEDFGRYVSSGKVNFFKQAGIDFVPAKRDGCYLYDMDGKKY